jgi:hypothetical protein
MHSFRSGCHDWASPIADVSAPLAPPAVLALSTRFVEFTGEHHQPFAGLKGACCSTLPLPNALRRRRLEKWPGPHHTDRADSHHRSAGTLCGCPCIPYRGSLNRLILKPFWD